MDSFNTMLDSMVEDIFLCFDLNNDGYLQKDELEPFVQGILKNIKRFNINWADYRKKIEDEEGVEPEIEEAKVEERVEPELEEAKVE